ncbi:glycoside hydrolase family 5 protein [Luteolibacter sp. SL250]|uniref:glycoside hydrolase family 5 protein n=1 Tax=Luteolibacter sp. SL250 TaxID=2995170 RepID=UPI00226EF589|nr:glycoside hydrolase family 5 protein [Luteolibacter sp. SL250]WAC21526.1 glycoside hydrolase family 5 protein [Luteolibacter sp. SL250]
MKPFPILAATFIALAATASAQNETLRQAGEGRVFLKTPADQPPLTGVSVTLGSATDALWEKDPAKSARQKDIRFGIRSWEWQEIRINFTPTYDGPLELSLAGLWEQEQPGKIYRQEILWDSLVTSGTAIMNGGFEARAGAVPDGWTSQGTYPGVGEWPLEGAASHEGKSVGTSWHNRMLSQTLQVKKGNHVTITLQARAANLPGYVAPKTYPKDSAAHQAAAKIKRGVNLGNCWEVGPPFSWKVPYTPDDIDKIAAEGFDHIRIPVAWHHHMTKTAADTYEIKPGLLAELDPVIQRAIEKNLHILLDWHHFYELDKDPTGHRQQFVRGWHTIATHYKDASPLLFFELLNEPHDKLTTELLNPIQAEAIATIRGIHPQRVIFLSTGDWGKIEELDKLILPDDGKLVVTVHCYEPFIFTHQNSSWTYLKDLKNITYPGPPATPVSLPESLKGNRQVADLIQRYNTVQGIDNPSSPQKMLLLLDAAKRWSDHFGRPIHLGEFGAIDAADAASRARYVKDVKEAAESRGIPWTLWDWKAKFAYWDKKAQQPLLRGAIFE